jgi:hypothetical protein
MSTTTRATLPRAAANGLASVVNKVNEFFLAAKENAVAFVGALREVLKTDEANETAVRKLYRLSNGGDSVSPQVLEALRRA